MTRPPRMTAQRLQVLRCIVEYHQIHHFSPSYTEIIECVDSQRLRGDLKQLSTSAVRFHLIALAKEELIFHEPGVARGYAPTPKGIDYLQGVVNET